MAGDENPRQFFSYFFLLNSIFLHTLINVFILIFYWFRFMCKYSYFGRKVISTVSIKFLSTNSIFPVNYVFHLIYFVTYTTYGRTDVRHDQFMDMLRNKKKLKIQNELDLLLKIMYVQFLVPKLLYNHKCPSVTDSAYC